MPVGSPFAGETTYFTGQLVNKSHCNTVLFPVLLRNIKQCDLETLSLWWLRWDLNPRSVNAGDLQSPAIDL